MSNLINSDCISSPDLLKQQECSTLLAEIEDWEINNEKKIIFREFKFKNYYTTIAFINAVAWIVHKQDHHPDIKFGYNKCEIKFNTHSVQGLSKNDFICAAKINDLLPC